MSEQRAERGQRSAYQNVWYVVLLAAIIAMPLVMRRRGEEHPLTGRQLVVITPHNESIRYEMEMAFREYYRRKHGEDITIDWRTIGGTSEIVRYIRSTYVGNFGSQWRKEHPSAEWNDAFGTAVFSPKTGPEHPAYQARQEFLASECSIDMDVFYGGGQYDMSGLGKAGMLVCSGVSQRHPEWFEGSQPFYQKGGGGETWYDEKGTYYATCYSTFGMIFNHERLSQAGYANDEISEFGKSWRDLSDDRLYGAIGVADPSQSGSINKCFEMLIQFEMQRQLSSALQEGRKPSEQELEEAWKMAMRQIKLIGGNAAYLTFSASKVPADAASGQIAAGMCIDSYGRAQVSWQEEQLGRHILSYRTPDGGSTVSADPIGILRGAPHRKDAEEFVDFILSYEAQCLYGLRRGTPKGPRKHNLYRLPAHSLCYAPDMLANSNTTLNPYQLARQFTYHGEWTGRLFSLIRNMIKIMVIDCGPELRECRRHMIAKGGFDALTDEEKAAFDALPFTYKEASGIFAKADSPEKQAVMLRQWIEFFRSNYKKIK